MKNLVLEVGSSLTQISVLDCVIFIRLVNFLSSRTVAIFPFTAHLIALIQRNVVFFFFLFSHL